MLVMHEFVDCVRTNRYNRTLADNTKMRTEKRAAAEVLGEESAELKEAKKKRNEN